MSNYFFRNPSICIAHPGRSWKATKAMREYKRANPLCEWCGDTKSKKHVHHLKPVQYYPELAADKDNFATVCGKGCHIYVAHGGNYNHYIENFKTVCSIARLNKGNKNV